VVAVMDGVVMGGGVGLSAHASHRIVTERSAVAMPEAGIGFSPTWVCHSCCRGLQGMSEAILH
jgi:enoyl-CoA hydratase/carnithine racemase